MTVQPKTINEFEQLVRHEQHEVEEMFAHLRKEQPYLFDWIVAKFNTLESLRALQGVTLSAMVMMQEDNEQARNELIKTILDHCDHKF